MNESIFNKTIQLIDSANSKDPNSEESEGKSWPKELLYSHRMTEMLERYKPESDEIMGLAIRGQHIERWKSPRKDYPMNKKGYYQWRTNLYKFHANTVGDLMKEAGYDDASIERIKTVVGKKDLKHNLDTQLLEDVIALVFIEHYLLDFYHDHPEYDEDKWKVIIVRTWNKMTEDGHKFALSGALKLPESLVPLIQKSIA
ncbi:MAG: DUF4202 domain-containing protein [Gammaproteobacteria bacterium]|nr:DUF4202 domain-containing protein [Gammaproteobacteria bacterium]